MNIPKVIQKAANSFLKAYPGSTIVHLGNYEGNEAFYVRLADGVHTGFPPVYLLINNRAVEIIGERSLEIISSLDPPV